MQVWNNMDSHFWVNYPFNVNQIIKEVKTVYLSIYVFLYM